MRAETAAKKNPKSAISAAPAKPTGTAGAAHTNTATLAIPHSTGRSGRSRPAPPSSRPPLPDAAANVRAKSGMDRTSDRKPPIAIAPAPT